MIMMFVGSRFVAGAAVAEIMALQYAGLFEEADGAIDGCDRDAAVDRCGAFMQGLDIGMVIGFGEDARASPGAAR